MILMAPRKKRDKGKDQHTSQRMIRIPEDLYLELRNLAKGNDRPMTWEVRLALRKHLAESQKGKAAEEGNDQS